MSFFFSRSTLACARRIPGKTIEEIASKKQNHGFMTKKCKSPIFCSCVSCWAVEVHAPSLFKRMFFFFISTKLRGKASLLGS